MNIIDKIKAEVEKKTHGEQGYSSEDAECGYRDCAKDILAFLDTLEVKEVDLGSNSFDANSILERIDNKIDRLLFNNCREINYEEVIQMIRCEIRTIRNEIKAQKGE